MYHKTHYANSKRVLASVANLQINNLTKDLFLELPHQMNPLVFQVDAETEGELPAALLHRMEEGTALCHIALEGTRAGEYLGPR